MEDLSQLLTPLPFPSSLERVRRSFARQPDCQTCGASAIRHGLLLGGLTIPTAALESVLGIRANEGTAPAILRACLVRLGLEVRPIQKPCRRKTADFLDSLRPAFDEGAFLVPCILDAAHWVCVGVWRAGRVGLVDSFFDGSGSGGEPMPRLGFFDLSPDEFDVLDWDHHVMLVRPGVWQAQYRAWLPARPSLLRMKARQANGRGVSFVQAIRQGAHQHLDDAESEYHRLELRLARGTALSVEADDPGGGDAVGVESLGSGTHEVLVVRRLGRLIEGRPAVPELVMRAGALRAGQLAG